MNTLNCQLQADAELVKECKESDNSNEQEQANEQTDKERAMMTKCKECNNTNSEQWQVLPDPNILYKFQCKVCDTVYDHVPLVKE